MSAVKTLMVLLALALALISSQAAPTGPDCEGLNKTVSENQLHKVRGHWVLVWGLSHGPNSSELLTNLKSSHLVMTMSDDNTTMTYHEKNLHGDVCTTFTANLTVTSVDNGYKISTEGGLLERNGVVKFDNLTEVVTIFESCAECMPMLFEAERTSYLLIYRREGHHLDSEQVKSFYSHFEQLAECLNISQGLRFTYDVAADFCHKKSSPEETSD